MKVRIRAGVWKVALALWASALATESGWASRSEEAGKLYRRALSERRDSFESRRLAMKQLERATLLAPDSVSYHLELARLYFSMGFLGQARRRYERVGQLRPDLAEGHLGQGLAWRRDYLKYLDKRSLDRSIAKLEEAGRLSSQGPDAWLYLVPLLVEEARLGEAMSAAEQARRAAPDRPEALLAVGHVAFRLGQVERADSAFRAAIPHLPRAARDRFHDIAPLASERDTATLRRLSPPAREEFVARFWKDNDPDLATAENEAQLEYWSRVTQAFFLFFNARRQQWDQRGEVYVRYGPPRKAEYNPVGSTLYLQKRDGAITYTQGIFPVNVQVWSYPELGMTVPMQDRILSEYYLPPISMTSSTDPAPHPDSLAARDGSLATAGGRGVFPMLPPGSKPVLIAAVLARFLGDHGTRLLGWLESPGGPSDSLWGEWVVLDSARHEVARLRRPLAASACDATELRMAEFASELAPGDYLVGFSVRGRDGKRATRRETVRLRGQRRGLDLSDVVVSCGPPDVSTQAVRLSVTAGAEVSDEEPLTVYFETYHLMPGPDGLSRFEYEYVVRSAERDPRIWIQRLVAPRRSLPEISATRREEQMGALRRQFVSVPVQALPPGRYRLEIRVRDLQAGSEEVASTEFVRTRRSGG
jgi:GWxTD domain-containing protein